MTNQLELGLDTFGAVTGRVLGADRFDLKYSNGTLPHDQMMRSIELYGTKVAPMVRDMLA